MNEMSTEFANFRSNLCKPHAKTRVSKRFEGKVAGVTDPPQYPQAIELIEKSKIVCNQVIPLNTHEYSRICKPNGRRPIC